MALLNGVYAYQPELNAAGNDTLSTRCVTNYARSPATAELQTRWSMITSCTETSTCTETCTKTPAGVTTTVTVDTVTCTVTDSTATSTATIFSSVLTTDTTTTTSTITSTATTTSVSITSTATETVPTSFRPVQDSFSGSSYDGSSGPDPVSPAGGIKRSISKHVAREESPVVPKDLFAQLVICDEIDGKCAKTTTTVTTTCTLAPTTSTVSTTATTTTTITPSACTSTTVTTTIGTTTTATATSTTTSTSTVISSTSTTVYAACATDNFATQGPDGADLSLVYGMNGDGFDNIMSAYDCCVQAITVGTRTSGQISQAWSWSPSENLCFSWNDGETCPNPPNMNVRITKAGDGDRKYISGNAYCGQITAYVDGG